MTSDSTAGRLDHIRTLAQTPPPTGNAQARRAEAAAGPIERPRLSMVLFPKDEDALKRIQAEVSEMTGERADASAIIRFVLRSTGPVDKERYLAFLAEIRQEDGRATRHDRTG